MFSRLEALALRAKVTPEVRRFLANITVSSAYICFASLCECQEKQLKWKIIWFFFKSYYYR